MKLIFVACAFWLLAGCCKEICIGDEVTVSFERFKALETDTVLFVRYPPHNSTLALDSFRVVSQISSLDTSRSSVAQSLSASYHWKVSLPSLNRDYRFENFDFTTEKCNCGGKNYKSVRSYTVNGVRKEGLFIRLEK